MDRSRTYKKQQGAALVVAMVLLLLLTLMGTDSMRTSMLDMHLSKGFKDQNYAFQSAETGLRLAEKIIQNTDLQSELSAALASANISYVSSAISYHTEGGWGGISQVDVGHEFPTKVVVQEWRFVPDSLSVGEGRSTGLTYYRITARGTDPAYNKYVADGSSEDYKKARTVVVLQSIYVVRHAY
ncbi:pilus assembly PilX family protein [Parendozoicomonas haliclonae]|uniref:Type 4 fimbrial biogenesis protein PilX N-terminal domain-containing protein n=1 Tax=Parendozoicomonas haliclonae TaxID=1960125 RepID=A0A1X7AQG0_9GAMM|nr:PilX N-terminal domain-containing pilus assembly protein [Parendozoicomonas haliclonae]SMA50372.1 hypothetical protein EHSB41UT_04169 [Parendozoicomonas haliclonae]